MATLESWLVFWLDTAAGPDPYSGLKDLFSQLLEGMMVGIPQASVLSRSCHQVKRDLSHNVSPPSWGKPEPNGWSMGGIQWLSTISQVLPYFAQSCFLLVFHGF